MSEQSRTTQKPATVNASGKSTQTTTLAGSTQSQAAPDSAAASKVTRQLSRNSVPQPITAPAFQSVADFVSAFTDKKRTIDNLTKKFVAKVGEAKQAQDDILPHLAYMQSLLSKKGTNHHLVVAARKQGKKIPWWTDYYEAYKDKLWGCLRTMERRIAAYRNDPTEPASQSDPDPVPHLNKSARKALIEGNHKAVEIVVALEAGRDAKREIAEFKAVMNATRLDDIMQAHEQELDYKSILLRVVQTVSDMNASLPPAFVRSVAELTKPCKFKITEPALEDGKGKIYLVRYGSRNGLQEMIYSGRDADRYVFIPTGKSTGYASLAKNAPKVWEQDEIGELKPVKIPNKLVLIRKVSQ